MDFIFTPFNRGYWEVKQQVIGTVALFVLAGACLPAAIILVETMLMLSLVMFSASAILAGVGLFRTLKQLEPPAESDLELDQAFAI